MRRGDGFNLERALAALERGLELTGRAVIVLGPTGEMLLGTDQADRWLETYCGSRMHGWALPEPLASWVRAGSSEPGGPPLLLAFRPLVLTRGARRLVIDLLADAAAGEFLLLLREEPNQPLIADPIAALGLTLRQVEVLRWVAEGQTNVEVARRLGVSPRTVQKHLRLIYDRLGVTTRTAAARRLFEK